MLAGVKAKQSKDLTIVIQPFGRSARVDNGDIIDDSTRSIEPHVYHKLVKKLSQKYNIILMAEPDFVNLVSQDDQISEKPQGVDLRFWSAVIELLIILLVVIVWVSIWQGHLIYLEL